MGKSLVTDGANKHIQLRINAAGLSSPLIKWAHVSQMLAQEEHSCSS